MSQPSPPPTTWDNSDPKSRRPPLAPRAGGPYAQRFSHGRSSRAGLLSQYFTLFLPLWLEPIGFSDFLLKLNVQAERVQTVSVQFPPTT